MLSLLRRSARARADVVPLRLSSSDEAMGVGRRAGRVDTKPARAAPSLTKTSGELSSQVAISFSVALSCLLPVAYALQACTPSASGATAASFSCVLPA